MHVRWCCKEFKETAGAGKVTLIGIRHEESSRRAKRNEVEISSRKFSGTLEQLDDYRERVKRGKNKGINITNATGERTLGCIHGKESLLISPIIHWTEEDVWEFLNKVVQVPHCELYDIGFNRIGCILCPMISSKQKRFEEQRYPHIKRNWLRTIKKIRMGRGITRNDYLTPHRKNYGLWAGFSESSSPDGLTEEQENEIVENIYEWWISGKSYKKWYAENFLQQKFNFED